MVLQMLFSVFSSEAQGGWFYDLEFLGPWGGGVHNIDCPMWEITSHRWRWDVYLDLRN